MVTPLSYTVCRLSSVIEIDWVRLSNISDTVELFFFLLSSITDTIEFGSAVLKTLLNGKLKKITDVFRNFWDANQGTIGCSPVEETEAVKISCNNHPNLSISLRY